MFNLGTILNTIGETFAGLGLVPAENRSVKPMPEALKRLVPAPVDNNITVKPNIPDTERDTMPLIIEKAKRTAYQVKKLAETLKGATLATTLRNDSKFILDYIKYKKDDAAHEQIRSPRRLVYDGQGDCDCFAVFLATLLINQKIDFRFRIAKYKAGDWAHIYIVVPKDQNSKGKLLNAHTEYFVLDPVTNQHDYEVKFLDKKDYNMALQFLDGVPDGFAPEFIDPFNQKLDGLGCACGVSKNDYNKPVKKKPVYVVSKKTLEDRGLMVGSEYLKTVGLPYKALEDKDGVPFYEVTSPNGARTKVAGFVPMDSSKQEIITREIMTAQAPTENKTVMASATNITPGKAVSGIAVALAVVAVLDHFRSNGSEKGLGALPKKKLPVVHI